ncbi:WXG100 family type VII secretion target [Nocardia sp. NPDC058518]|uniref:WXG100 family type VII secretion target n=1 Tax=Nocardia sp. NPDC058518 TaxID=3346534 RepID=UPI00364787E0
MSTPGGSDGGSLSVVPTEVQAVGRYVYGIAEALRTALTSANTEVDTLLAGGWSGDLATLFGTGWTETHDGGTTIITALTDMANKLGITADNYQQQDTNRAYSLNTSSLDLPGL